jgi:hypothetical protein
MLSIGSQRMKINAENFKGIEFVQLNQLPENQRIKILESLNSNFIIKILIDGKIIGNCLQYKDYDFWYDNIFNTKHSSYNIESRKEEDVVENMAFQN